MKNLDARKIGFAILLALAGSLVGCATPGVVVYGDPVTHSDAKGGSHVTVPKMVAINADVTGDVEVPGKLHITTPRDGSGNILVQRTAILSKDGTQVIGYNEKPMVAEIRTTPVWVAFFRGGQSWLNSVGTTLVSAFGLGAIAGTGSAAVGTVTP